MSDQLADSAQKLFSQHVDKDVLKAAEKGDFPQALWDAVVGAGFTAALLPEEAGGFGASVAEALRLLQIAAEHTAPIPLAETMLAGWLLARAGLSVPEGVLTLAPVRRGEVLSARARRGWLAAERDGDPGAMGAGCRIDRRAGGGAGRADGGAGPGRRAGDGAGREPGG